MQFVLAIQIVVFQRILLVGALLTLTACTSFSSVRSAEVYRGPALALQGTVTTAPGDDAAWFWGLDCSSDCNRVLASVDGGVAFGSTSGATPFSVGAGVSGILYPYLEGYAQLNRAGQNPWGAGVRIGVPVQSWTEHQLFARFDRPLGDGKRLLLNATLFLHTGNSPNGANPGHMLAFVPGVGVLFEGETMSFVPAISLGVGRGERRSVSLDEGGPFTTAFGTVSMSVVAHRKRAAKP
jgi:hypothetical protein